MYVYMYGVSPCGIVVNVLYCDFAVLEFELQSRWGGYFWNWYPREKYDFPYTPS